MGDFKLFNLNDIDDFKINKKRIAIPKAESKPGYNNIIFLLGNSKETNAALVTNKLLNYQNLYKNIYKDIIYKGKFYNKSYYLKYRNERDEDYDYYKQQIPSVHPATQFKSLSQKNVFIDNTVLLNHYFTYVKTSISVVCAEFVNLLKLLFFNPRYEGYTTKYALLDIQNWNLHHSDVNKQNIFSNPISLLFIGLKKFPELIKTIGDIQIVILNGDQALFKFNPSKINVKSFLEFKREINKFKDNLISDDIEKEIDSGGIEPKEDGSKPNDKVKDIKNIIDKKVIKTDKENISEILHNESEEEEKKIDTTKLEDEEIDQSTLDELQTVITSNVMAKSKASSARDAELKEQIKDIKWNRDGKTTTLGEVLKNTDYVDIGTVDVSDKVNTLNENITKVKFTNFEKSYNQNNLHADLLNDVVCLSERKDLPVFVRDVKVEDSSDAMNQKETYTFYLEDGNRVRHTLKIDVPKFVDDKFMYLGGNKKIFIKQLILKPIVKIAPDVVQICTNYNKIFMYRYGEVVSPKIEKFKKFILAHPEWFELTKGNGFAENNNHKTTIEYDSIAKEFIKIKIKGSSSEFIFSQKRIDDKLEDDKNIDFDDDKNQLPFGFYKDGNKTKVFSVDCEGSQNAMVNGEDEDAEDTEMDIVDTVIQELVKVKNIKDAKALGFDKIKTGKRFMYTRCTVMQKKIPTIIFLSYFEGLSTVLRKANIAHHFTDKRPMNLTSSEGYIEFANGYLIYDRYPIQNSLLLNSLEIIPTKDYNYEDFDDKPVYLDIFDILFNSRILASGLDAYYDNMIDPITLSILKEMNYPTDFVELVLYASALLADNNYTSEIDMNVFRVRSNEMVAAHLYKIVSNAYSRYKRTANNKNPVKISVNQDALIREILTSQVVEDYSILNPIVETEKTGAITSKGPSGINLDEAYTQEKRSYHKSMTGLMGISTSPDAGVGLVRELTFEPIVEGTRGFIDVKDNLNDVTDANLFTSAELLTPLGVSHDDSIRTAMATKQS